MWALNRSKHLWSVAEEIPVPFTVAVYELLTAAGVDALASWLRSPRFILISVPAEVAQRCISLNVAQRCILQPGAGLHIPSHVHRFIDS